MKGKKVLLFIIIIIILGGVAAGCWYVGNKYSNKDDKKTEEKKNKMEIVVKYETKKYDRSTDNKGLIINNSLSLPSSISVENGDKIVEYMNKALENDWTDIKEQTDYAIDNYDPDFQYNDQYGIEYVTNHYINKNLIVFNVVTSGSMGGVGWHESRYYNFNLETGEAYKLEDFCKDVKACKEFMVEEFNKLLKTDQRFKNLEEGYQKIVAEEIFKEGNFGLSKDGLTLTVPEYKISDGAAGNFVYTLSYLELDEYLKDEFKV